jgi:hydrogenase/urease accessory protein HupE
MRPLLLALRSLCVALGALSMSAWGHEVRPAFLSVTERPDGRYDILWKQPTMGEVAVRLGPHIEGAVLDREPSDIERVADFQVSVWRDVDAGAHGLEGRTLEIEGLGETITDVLVAITPADGATTQEILHPQNPRMTLHLHRNGLAMLAYVRLGIEHILTGIDHLAFVLGLTLLVRRRMMLIKTITAFTLAHSITLAATTLHLIFVRPAVIEALVALSVLFVAVEIVYGYRGRTGLAMRYPWLIASTFGLLHGAAFAGALAEVGLPPNAIAPSLLLFNVGVELGQLVFIGLILGIGWALARLPTAPPAWMRWIAPYTIGSCAAFWCLERLQAALSQAAP